MKPLQNVALEVGGVAFKLCMGSNSIWFQKLWEFEVPGPHAMTSIYRV